MRVCGPRARRASSLRATVPMCALMSSFLGISPLGRSPRQRDVAAVSPHGHDPLAIACRGAMTQRAVRCPNVRVLLGNGHGQVLGAEPLRLLAAAHLGDAMEQDVPLGTRGCAEVQGDLAASGVGSDFCLRWCWQERSHVRDMFPVVSCSLGGDAAWICRDELSVRAVKGVEWCGLCGLSCGNTTRSSPELLWS